MGHKVHPVGFRLGINQPWQARWFADRDFAQVLKEDLKMRQEVAQRYRGAGVSRVDIERQGQVITLTVRTSRPGMVIGRDGKRVDEVRQALEALTKKRVKIQVSEVYQPELDATLLAYSVAEQIERRVALRRAMRQTAARAIQAGAKGVKIICSGRLMGSDIARRQVVQQGSMPLQTLRADIDFAVVEAHTLLGRIGVKAWVYRGEVQPQKAAGTEGAKE